MCPQIYGFEVFQRYIVVSPSIGIDDAWNPLFTEMRKRDIDPDEYTLDHYDDAWRMNPNAPCSSRNTIGKKTLQPFKGARSGDLELCKRRHVQ